MSRRGFVFGLDYSFGPAMKVPDEAFGLGREFGRRVPTFVWIAAGAKVLPPEVLVRVVLVGILWGAGLAAWWCCRALAPVRPPGFWGPLYAGLLYQINPFVYQRLAAGHWHILAGYAFFPVVVVWAARLVVSRLSVRSEFQEKGGLERFDKPSAWESGPVDVPSSLARSAPRRLPRSGLTPLQGYAFSVAILALLSFAVSTMALAIAALMALFFGARQRSDLISDSGDRGMVPTSAISRRTKRLQNRSGLLRKVRLMAELVAIWFLANFAWIFPSLLKASRAADFTDLDYRSFLIRGTDSFEALLNALRLAGFYRDDLAPPSLNTAVAWLAAASVVSLAVLGGYVLYRMSVRPLLVDTATGGTAIDGSGDAGPADPDSRVANRPGDPDSQDAGLASNPESSDPPGIAGSGVPKEGANHIGPAQALPLLRPDSATPREETERLQGRLPKSANLHSDSRVAESPPAPLREAEDLGSGAGRGQDIKAGTEGPEDLGAGARRLQRLGLDGRRPESTDLAHDRRLCHGLFVFFSATAVMFLVAALGERAPFVGPVLSWVLVRIPGWQIFREPQKLLVPTALAYAYLGGVGVEYLLRRFSPDTLVPLAPAETKRISTKQAGSDVQPKGLESDAQTTSSVGGGSGHADAALIGNAEFGTPERKGEPVPEGASARAPRPPVRLLATTERVAVVLGALILPLAFCPELVFAMSRRLVVAEFPKEWSSAAAFMPSSEGKLLLFPWHQHMPFEFTKGVTTVDPSQDFYAKKVVGSLRVEFPGFELGIADPTDAYVRDLIGRGGAVSDLAEALLPLGVDSVVLYKTADWTAYRFLDTAPGLEKVLDNSQLALYRVVGFRQWLHASELEVASRSEPTTRWLVFVGGLSTDDSQTEPWRANELGMSAMRRVGDSRDFPPSQLCRSNAGQIEPRYGFVYVIPSGGCWNIPERYAKGWVGADYIAPGWGGVSTLVAASGPATLIFLPAIPILLAYALTISMVIVPLAVFAWSSGRSMVSKSRRRQDHGL